MNPEIREYLETWRKGEIIPSPAAAFLGSQLVNFSDGFAEVTLRIDPDHLNSFGTIQGGLLCALADVAMGTAVATTLNPGEQFSTSNLDSMFCRPATSGILHASARVIFRGRSATHAECGIMSGDRLVARFSSTCMIRKNNGTD